MNAMWYMGTIGFGNHGPSVILDGMIVKDPIIAGLKHDIIIGFSFASINKRYDM